MSEERRFAFDLALAVGEPDVDAMMDRIPLRTFMEWIQYAGQYAMHNPFGEGRANIRAAVVACEIARANPFYKISYRRRLRADEFMEEFGVKVQRRKRRQSQAEIKAVLMGWAQGQNVIAGQKKR